MQEACEGVQAQIESARGGPLASMIPSLEAALERGDEERTRREAMKRSLSQAEAEDAAAAEEERAAQRRRRTTQKQLAVAWRASTA